MQLGFRIQVGIICPLGQPTRQRHHYMQIEECTELKNSDFFFIPSTTGLFYKFLVKTQVHGNRNAPSERMFKPIMPRKVSLNESPWEIQLEKKATTTYLSPVVDPFVCVYLLVVSSSSSRLVFLYLSSVVSRLEDLTTNTNPKSHEFSTIFLRGKFL